MKIDGPIKHIIVLDLLEDKPQKNTVTLARENRFLKLQNNILKLLLNKENDILELVVVTNSESAQNIIHNTFEESIKNRLKIESHLLELSSEYYDEAEDEDFKVTQMLSLAYEKLPDIVNDIVKDNYQSAIELPVLSELDDLPIWFYGVEYIQDDDEYQSWQEYFDYSDLESLVPYVQKPRAKTWFYLFSKCFNQYDCENWQERNEFARMVAAFASVFHKLEVAGANGWDQLEGEQLLKLPFDPLWLGFMANEYGIGLDEYSDISDAEADIAKQIANEYVSIALAELSDTFSGSFSLLFVLWFSIFPDYSQSSNNKLLEIGSGYHEMHELRGVWQFIETGTVDSY